MMWAKLKQRWLSNRTHAWRATVITVLVGVVLWRLPMAEGLVHWSFDLPTRLAPAQPPSNLLLIRIDEPTLTELRQSYYAFNRTNHVNLLQKLTAASARLVVFDIFFPESDPHPEDLAFAAAIQANGRVVLAADYSPLSGYAAGTVSPPREPLRVAARGWGVSLVELESDMMIRRHCTGPESRPSLAWAAAEVAKAPVTRDPNARYDERWIRYYGGDPLPSMSYFQALLQEPAYFKDKTIFIGGKPATRGLHEEVDEFATPYTHWGGPLMSGLELQAATFLNLREGHSVVRLSAWGEVLLLLLCGLIVGCGFSLLRPATAAILAVVASATVAVAAGFLFWYGGVWFSWLLMAGAQVPCAWACVAVLHARAQHRNNELEKMGAPTQTPVAELMANQVTRVGERVPPAIADYTLLQRIGKGAYGEVHLARNAIGLYHAVKLIYRVDFAEASPYEREFRGIQKYMPISLNHPGLAHVLHVGRNDQAGYFYYVMELGDGQSVGTPIDPETFVPRNLSEEFRKRGRLSVLECLDLFLPLAAALEYLHSQNLVHRDIKPSNIIFVRGVPKFTDIGLVTDAASHGSEISYVGTQGYIAPEGPGTHIADIYSLGIVLYQAATGLDRNLFPELPAAVTQGPEIVEFIQLNRIILKACQSDVARRYRSVAELRGDLIQLQKCLVKRA